MVCEFGAVILLLVDVSLLLIFVKEKDGCNQDSSMKESGCAIVHQSWAELQVSVWGKEQKVERLSKIQYD